MCTTPDTLGSTWTVSTSLPSLVIDEKICTRCKIQKPFSDFHSLTKAKDGKQLRCKQCLAEMQREYRKKRPTDYWQNKDKKYALKKRYGLSISDFEKMVAAQNGLCAVCKRDPKKMGVTKAHQILHVDHNHATGKVRSLLCNGCNRAIGLINENVDAAKALASYILTGGNLSVILEAETLINGDRQAAYGHPLIDFNRTAGMVNAAFADKLKEPLTAEDMMMVMVLVKLSRQRNLPKRDNLVDACGYLGCIELAEQKRNSESK